MAAAGLALVAWLAEPAQAEVEDIACSELEKLSLGGGETYDETMCMAGNLGGLASGESRRPVGVYLELIIAYNRATFAIVRLDSSNNRTYMELDSVQDHVEGIFSGFEPRNWGEERSHDRFVLADVEARIAEDSPYLDCVAFLVRMRPVGLAPGYKEALGGLYCAMDTLQPTEEEVTAFLDGLKF
jgi:hypothetical protein